MDASLDKQTPAEGELTARQRDVLRVIEGYCQVTGEPCSARYMARRLSVHHSTIQQHLAALHRKGWLRTPNAPAMPVRFSATN